MISNTADTNWDAIIIGGGPSGASAAAMLAGQGHRVLVLEREKFPRYHVGESMIPFTYGPLERLGLIPKLKGSAFQKKFSVQFTQPNGQASQPFYFFTRYDKETVAQTWQVLRSEFDEMLLNHARERGAEVMEEIAVRELVRQGETVLGVKAIRKDGTLMEFRAPITLDCSGKESFAAVRNGWRAKDPYLNKVAVWTYYQGSKREQGIDVTRVERSEPSFGDSHERAAAHEGVTELRRQQHHRPGHVPRSLHRRPAGRSPAAPRLREQPRRGGGARHLGERSEPRRLLHGQADVGRDPHAHRQRAHAVLRG